jgi:hypothetical protein
METGNRFTGLNMPVFTAFGWAGEENAIKYALSQLEMFVQALQGQLPRTIQMDLPFYGVSQVNQGVYLAASKEVDSDGHIAFFARPLSLEIQLAIVEKQVAAKGLARAVKDPANAHHLITQLGPEWTLRIQQLQIDENSGEILHYLDLFKDSVKMFDPETAVETFNKALYLNGEENWAISIYLSRRFASEQASAMGAALTQVVTEHVASLMPVFRLLTGRVKGKTRAAARSKSSGKAKAAADPIAKAASIAVNEIEETFTYVSELKPLHIRRGFINLTTKHWPFFALNARTETRNVTIYYDGIYDKKSAVWRLQPSDQARIMLSPSVQEWLEGNFSANDKVKVIATKLENNELQVTLTAVDQ